MYNYNTTEAKQNKEATIFPNDVIKCEISFFYYVRVGCDYFLFYFEYFMCVLLRVKDEDCGSLKKLFSEENKKKILKLLSTILRFVHFFSVFLI